MICVFDGINSELEWINKLNEPINEVDSNFISYAKIVCCSGFYLSQMFEIVLFYYYYNCYFSF